MKYAAFIRGINLGPSRRVRMADLRGALEAAGYGGVRTYLQSGNVVLDSEQPAAVVAAAVRAATGLDAAVVVRTQAQMRAIVRDNPFPQVDDGRKLHVAFCDGPAAEPGLDAAGFAPEGWAVRGEEVYLWLPDGMARSPLMQALGGRAFGVTATLRNWNTVTAVADLLEA